MEICVIAEQIGKSLAVDLGDLRAAACLIKLLVDQLELLLRAFGGELGHG